MNQSFEPFPRITYPGKAFLKGWDNYDLRKKNLVFWEPVDRRWETYGRDRVTFLRLHMHEVPVEDSNFGRRSALRDVLNLGAAWRVLDPKAMWDPREGLCDRWHDTQQVPLTLPPAPLWFRQLNAVLGAVSSNSHMTPEERAKAREALVTTAYSSRTSAGGTSERRR